MHSDIQPRPNERCIQGSGQMYDLIQSKDWENNAMGAIPDWSPVLVNLLNVLLACGVPMFLFWGPEFICFFNDACLADPTDAGSHLDMLGCPAKEARRDLWPVLSPAIELVIHKGISVGAVNQPNPVYGLAGGADSNWTFNYSPVRDEQGAVAGVLLICIDNTALIMGLNKAVEHERQFLNLVTQSPVAMAIFKGKDFMIDTANDSLLEKIWFKKRQDVLGRPLMEVFPELATQIFPQLLKEVFETGRSHIENAAVAYIDTHSGMKKFYLDYEYAPLYNPDKTVYGIMVTVINVTDQVEARQQIKDSEERLQLATEGTHLAIWDLNLQNGQFVYSPRLAMIFGYHGSTALNYQEMQGLTHPDDMDAVVGKAFASALQTGIYGYEARIFHAENGIRWIRTRGKVIFDAENRPLRMLGTMMDITDQKEIQDKVAMMAAIVQSSEDAIITKDFEGRITSWNNAARRIFGFSPEEIIGQPITWLIPDDRMEEEQNILKRLRNGERVEHFETQRKTKSNDILDISLTISLVRGAGGEIIGTSKIARDISSQKRIERLVSVSEEKFRLLADIMPQFIWTGNPSGGLQYFNRTFMEFSGLTSGQLEENGWHVVVHPEDLEENLHQWKHSVANGEPFLFEHRFRRHDGLYRWHLSRAVPSKDLDGNIQMWVGSSTDIDEIKRHEQQKDDFIKIASHELKTPVTTIKGYAQLLLKTHGKGDDVFLAVSLLTIEKQVSKLTKLIADLLDITKIETGNLQLRKEKISINALVQEVIKEIQATTPSHIISLQDPETLFVYADRYKMEQVIINLLTNAIKYSPKAGKILVDIRRSGHEVDFSVQDFGIGIATADHKKVFERFYRVSGKDERTYPGFGIGLFIVHEIISLHNGKTWVESEKEKGAVFHFSLPVCSII